MHVVHLSPLVNHLDARRSELRGSAECEPGREPRWQVLAALEPRALYKLRSASVECANAQFRRRGFVQITVRGNDKARCVVLWHALAHNLMRMASLGFLRPA